MDLLSDLLGSKARAKILSLLFTDEGRELYLRQIERETGQSIGAVQAEIKKLVNMDLLRSREDGNRRYFLANKDHPFFVEIKGLINKCYGMETKLKKLFEGLDEVIIAFIFGSYAKEELSANSDIDLFIVGNISSRKLAEHLFDLQKDIGREINEHIYKLDTFKKSVKDKKHFITSLKKATKIFIKGTENEFKKLYR